MNISAEEKLMYDVMKAIYGMLMRNSVFQVM